MVQSKSVYFAPSVAIIRPRSCVMNMICNPDVYFSWLQRMQFTRRKRVTGSVIPGLSHLQIYNETNQSLPVDVLLGTGGRWHQPVIGEDWLVAMTGAESLEWYQIHGSMCLMPFNLLRSRHYYEPSSPQQPSVAHMVLPSKIVM